MNYDVAILKDKLCDIIHSRYNYTGCQTCCEKCYIENLTIWLEYFKGEINGTNGVSRTTDS